MRSRLLEIIAALAGVLIVVFLYLDRSGTDVGESPPEREPAKVPVEPVVDTRPTPAARQSPGIPSQAITEVEPEPVVDSAGIAEAREVWETARAELEAVEAELEVLDQRFDAKEAELAEREAQGLDPEALEEEMLIFLDGIVDEYDELEARLAEAEALELEAAENLSRLGGRTLEP